MGYLEFNTFCAYVGERTPVYVNVERSKQNVNETRYDWGGGY